MADGSPIMFAYLMYVIRIGYRATPKVPTYSNLRDKRVYYITLREQSNTDVRNPAIYLIRSLNGAVRITMLRVHIECTWLLGSTSMDKVSCFLGRVRGDLRHAPDQLEPNSTDVYDVQEDVNSKIALGCTHTLV